MDISVYYPALAVFAFLTFISGIVGMAGVFGKPKGDYVYGFIICKRWPFITEKNYMAFIRFFRVMYYILLFMPIATIGVWVGVMFYLRRNDTYVGPISILLVSLSGACIIIGQRFVIWKRNRLTWTTIILAIISVLLILAYQLLGNFYYSLTESFFGISAMFLSYNCIIMIFILYINIGRDFVKFQNILSRYIKDTAEGFIPHPKHKDLVQCMEEDLANDKYALTIQEYKSFITFISSIGGTESENKFNSISPLLRLLINVFLYIISLGILAAYSAVAYDTEYEKLGLTISIAVVATDIMLYALYHSNVITTIGGACIMLIIFRGCLFGFGGKYWYYGCCVLYAIAGIKMAFEKVRQQFPFVETNRISLKEPIINAGTSARYKMDIFREPIVAWLFSTILFGVLSIILAFTEPNGVALPSLYLGDLDAPFWLMAILSFLLSVFCYFVMATTRIAVLNTMKYIPRIFKYFLSEGINEFWIYMLMAYIVIVSTGLILYYFIRDDLMIVYPVFCPLIALITIYSGMTYTKNGYSILYKFHLETIKGLLQKRKQESAIIRTNMKRTGLLLLAGDIDVYSDMSEELDENPHTTEDWRKTHNFFTAFFQGKLSSLDYNLIVSITLLVIVTFFLGFTIQMLGDDSSYPGAWIGVTSSIMVICFILVSGALFDHLSNGLTMSLGEIIVLIVGIGVYIIYGISFYQGRENGDFDIDYNISSFPIYAAIFPAIVAGLMGIYSRFVRAKFSLVCFILWGVTVLCLGILIVYVYLNFGVVPGTVTLGIIISLVVGAVILAISSYLPFKVKVIGGIVIVLIACMIMIFDFCEDSMDDFLGFSISYILIVGGVFASCVYSLFMSIWNWKTSPVIFSSLIVPAFKYKPLLSYPIPYYGKIYTMYICILVFFFWTVLLSIYIEPMHYGISVGLFTIVITLVISIFLSTYTSYTCKYWCDKIGDKTINSSWLLAKDRYIRRQGVTSLRELQTYQNTLDSKNRMLAADIKQAQGQGVPSDEKIQEYLSMSYRKKLIWLHKADDRIFALYQSELLFIVLFQMLTIMSAQSSASKTQQELVRFVKTRRNELKKQSIRISLKGVFDLDLRYYCILSQVQNMTPEKQVIFNNELTKYQTERQDMEANQRKTELDAQQKINEKLEMEHNKDSAQNIIKYKKIAEDYKSKNVKYVDKEFPNTAESLGNALASMVKSWKRATDEPNSQIFVGTVSPMDLIQGALGDCYFLSAISVMGEKNLRLCIKSTEEQAKSGAFLVKLYRGGQYEEHLLIDDYFPVNESNSWLFAQCNMMGTNTTTEMWPMILEKAYAKLYNSYERIEGGKVHIALAELTGGIPQYIKITETIQDNIDEFWQKLVAYNDNGYMLGAGTPENIRGDSAVNENGIVQGHAYAILDVQDYAGEKLIKLRNPHGSRGIEWNGDWSDESPMWTPAAIATLELKIGTDGVFWMSLNDFVDEFKYVYICRKFDDRWYVVTIEDFCSGEYTVKNNGLDMFPQYEVYVTKPTAIFLKMTQSETVSSFQGKYSIFTLILACDGKKAIGNNTANMVSSSLPPINYVSVTAELFADIYYTYPYRFTVVAGANNSTSNFTMKFYSTDPNMEVRKIN